MKLPNEQTIIDALRQIKAADGSDLTASGMIEGLRIQPAANGVTVNLALAVDPKRGEAFEPLRAMVEKTIRAVPGVAEAHVVLTAHKAAPAIRGNRPEKLPITGVKKIIAVASGKGGVGKSTTAVNLAAALADSGQHTGLLDADIYGPSVPRMLGLTGKPQVREDKKFIPMQKYGLIVMSMGFLVPEEAPMVWRGPMVHGALTQLFRDVAWNAEGDLDYLVIDLPPGTGDAQLTLAQSVPLAGAVVVSTPQDIALLDARKAIAMFGKVDVPVLGIVENMSYFNCPHCGERSEIFSHGGAKAEAAKFNVPFLGEIPLDIAVRKLSDAGEPIVLAQPNGAISQAYRDIAEKIKSAC